MLLGYVRVSKGDDQSPVLQRRALAQAGVERFFEETASGGRWERPERHRLLDQIRANDVVVVWKLDRLSRSLKDLLALLERIEEKGAGFRSLTEAVDTTLPAGRRMMQRVGAFAEFERALIRERTRAGLDAARREDRVGGHRPKLRADQRRDSAENILSGRRTGAQMARLYGVSLATVSRIVSELQASQLREENMLEIRPLSPMTRDWPPGRGRRCR